jgi:hypothetical protein
MSANPVPSEMETLSCALCLKEILVSEKKAKKQGITWCILPAGL